jgi:hypothetical protein
MDAEVRAARVGDLTVHQDVQKYPLEPGLSVTLTSEADAWRCAVVASAPSSDEPVYGADALTHLLRYQQIPPVDRFALVRHMHTPEASGERPVDDDGRVVVVGERVVVSWSRLLQDRPYTAPITLAQLAAVDFLGVPDTHGVLIWTTPSGYEAPVAVVTRYLPRALDSRQALANLLARRTDAEPSETPSLTARMGRITAALHVALGTRSRVLAEPLRPASTDELTDWHERIRSTIDRAALIAAEGTVPEAAHTFLPRLDRLKADADALLAAADDARPVLVQRVHGDLHAARILRWPGGLAITGFGDEPDTDRLSLGPQPPARDLARLLQSLDQLAEQCDEQAEAPTGEHQPGTPAGRYATEWLPGARVRLLAAYRTELEVARRPELFDEPVLAAFEAEHRARAVIDAAHQQASAGALDALDALHTAPVWEQHRDRR